MRASPKPVLSLIVFSLCAGRLPAQPTPPTAREVEALVALAHAQGPSGTEVRVPEGVINDLKARLSSRGASCTLDGHDSLRAHQFSGRGAPATLAIEGRGCLCSATGNCDLWVYQQKDDKYRMVLQTSMVQSFGFLRSQTHGSPDLVTWSHGSATTTDADLFRFDGDRYRSSGGWREEYRYLDSDGQVVISDKPQITSGFSSRDQLPDDVKR